MSTCRLQLKKLISLYFLDYYIAVCQLSNLLPVTLHSFLKCLGVYVDSKDPHPVFGNAKKLLEVSAHLFNSELFVIGA